MEEEENLEELERRRKRGLLKMYYGTGQDVAKQNPYDINEPHFQHNVYLEKMFKEKTLHELMDKESEVVKRKCCLQDFSQPAITCSKLTIKTLEEGMKYVQR